MGISMVDVVAETVARDKVIVGLGKTGLSCARHFARAGIPFSVVDSNPASPNVPALHDIAPGVEVGPLIASTLIEAEEVVLSPGVPLKHEAVQAAINAGVPVTGDVAMFSKLADRPIIAITGSNGKSTVTAMVGHLAEMCGKRPGVGGNIGTPCLDLLADSFDLYVLEVSSYQLEVAAELESAVAVVLNLAPDHLDRYDSVEDYYRTKAGIYRHTSVAVVNRDIDYDMTLPPNRISFGSDAPVTERDFGIWSDGEREWLCRGREELLATSELRIAGRHNQSNALAALAIGTACDWNIENMTDGLRTFAGLPHRCEAIGRVDGARFINDSKSTNVASTLAAVAGIGPEAERLTLILGGIGKGADFTRLAPTIASHVDRVFVFGQDRAVIAEQLAGSAPLEIAETLEEVVARIRATSNDGECVLFSPGCASLDQFDDFEARGDRFRALVTGGES